ETSQATARASGVYGVPPSSMRGPQSGRTTTPQLPPPSTPETPTPTAVDAASAKPLPPPPFAPVDTAPAAGDALSPKTQPPPSAAPASLTPTAGDANVVPNPKSAASATADPIVPVAPAVLPLSPRNVAATVGDGFVRLTWTLVPGATVYNIYRGLAPNLEVRLVVLSGVPSPPFVDWAVENGVNYYYRLTAVGDGGESPRSAEVSASPVAPPAAPDPATVAAFRFLRQATWGPKPGDVDLVKNL